MVIFVADKNVNSIIKNLFIMKKRLFLLAMCLISVVYSFGQTTENDYFCAESISYDYVGMAKKNVNYTISLVKSEIVDNEMCKLYCIRNNKTQAKTYRLTYKGGSDTAPILITIPNPKSKLSVITSFKAVFNELNGNQMKEIILFCYEKLIF